MEAGEAFCPNCRAPQIRVAGAPADRPAAPPLAPGTPGEIQPPATPVSWQPHQPTGYAPQPGFGGMAAGPARISWADALPGAALCGLLIALSFLPLLSVLLWPTMAGALAVVLYLRRRPEQQLTRGIGARIGSMAGVFGFLLFALLMVFELVVLRGGGQFRQAMIQMIQQSAARNPSPEAQAMVQKMLTPEGIAIMIGAAFVFALAVFAGFGAIGGAIGAKLAGQRKDRRF